MEQQLRLDNKKLFSITYQFEQQIVRNVSFEGTITELKECTHSLLADSAEEAINMVRETANVVYSDMKEGSVIVTDIQGGF